VSYGRGYDFSKPFFEQFGNIGKIVPRLPLISIENSNSDYVNYAIHNKSCYLIVSVEDNENCSYGYRLFNDKDCIDCENVHHSELCYECIQCGECYKCTFSQKLESCSEVSFSFNCRGCQQCFGCANLRNKKYCIFNEQYSKEEYIKKLGELSSNSYSGSVVSAERAKVLNLAFPRKFAEILRSNNCEGDNIQNSKDCFNSFNIRECKDLVNVFSVFQAFSSQDGCFIDFCERTYESIGGEKDSRKSFTYSCWGVSDLSYCDTCNASSNLFACIGLRSKQYCILNKQYTKEEYEELVPRIIEHMNTMPYVDSKGRIYKYGEFFPPELSPFAYNETIAQEYFPLTKEQALAQGYSWKDPEERNYQITIKPENLPDHIKDTKDDILNQVIGCAHEGKCNEQCTTAFKIIPEELQFYRRMNLPLPRLCPNCRHYERLAQRNPLKLWHRQCQCAGTKSENGVYANTAAHQHGVGKCPNEFETSYAPERKEIVYCEQCYNAEVV